MSIEKQTLDRLTVTRIVSCYVRRSFHFKLYCLRIRMISKLGQYTILDILTYSAQFDKSDEITVSSR